MIAPTWIAYGLAAAVALGAAGWLGHRWAEGAAALEAVERQADELAEQRRALDALLQQIEADREAWRTAAAEARGLADRFDTIAEELAANDEQTARRFAQLRRDMEAAFADRPDLRGLRVGAGLLEAWRRANAGPVAAAGAGAASADPVEPDPRLLGPAAAGG